MNLNLSLKHLCFATLLSIIMLLNSSCSSDKNKILESVPDDAEFVMTLNLFEFAQQANLSIEGGRLVMPREYSIIKENLPENFTKIIGQAVQAIDIENIVVFGYINKDIAYMTFPVKNADALRELLKGDEFELERDRLNGYEIYSESDSDYDECIVISNDETQAWFIPRRDCVKYVEDFEFARKKNNILRYSGLASALTADNITNAVFDMGCIDAMLGKYWLTTSANIDRNSISINASAITTDGEHFDTKDLQEISPEFLSYMPANFIGVTAVGINPEGTWLNQVKMLCAQQRRYSTDFEMAQPYLEALDGTIAFGFGPKSLKSFYSKDISDWEFITMVHMTPNKVTKLIDLIKDNIPGVKSDGKLNYIEDNGYRITFGNVDGYFAAAFNTDITKGNSNSFSSDFNGKNYAMILQTPMLNEIIDNPTLNYSVKASMDIKKSVINIDLKLVGTDAPIIPTLMVDAPIFFKTLMYKMENYSHDESDYLY